MFTNRWSVTLTDRLLYIASLEDSEGTDQLTEIEGR